MCLSVYLHIILNIFIGKNQDTFSFFNPETIRLYYTLNYTLKVNYTLTNSMK